MKHELKLFVELADPARSDAVWFHPGDRDDHGTGSELQPFGARGRFDELLARYGDRTIYLYPGTYHTRGVWAQPKDPVGESRYGYCALRNGALIGLGETTIFLSDPDTKDEEGTLRQDVYALWGYGSVRIENLNIVLQGNSPELVLGGIYVWGSPTVRNVRISGIRGDFNRQLEVFGIGNVSTSGGTRISDCAVYQATNYASAFSVGEIDANGLPSIVERCHASGTGAHFAFGGCCNVTFRDCSSNGIAYGFYNDTDRARNLLITGCRFRPEYSGVQLVYTHNPAWTKSRIRVVDSFFEFVPNSRNPTAPYIGLGLIDKIKSGSGFEDIWVRDCAFSVPRTPFVLVSSDATRLPAVVLSDNVVPSGTTKNTTLATLSRNLQPDGVLANVVAYQ